MKKLMIAAAVICIAVVSQAATVNWQSAAMYAPINADGTMGSGAGAAKAVGAKEYLITLTSDQYDGYAGMSYAEASAALWETYGGDKLKSKTPNATAAAMGTMTAKQTVDNSSGLHYGAVIITYTDTDGNDWYVANIGKANVTGSADVNVQNLGTKFGGTAGTAITAWTAVPEPTSGLLLLLGVAGLALKRKRA